MNVLYKETYKNPKILGLNMGYWSRMLKHMKIDNFQHIKVDCPFDSRKDLPLFVCTNGQRSLRIFQYDVYESDNYEKYAYITAWKDICHYKDCEFQELVVCLLLTKEYTQKVKELIKCWFKQEDQKVDCIIDEIYSLQKVNAKK